MTTAPFDPSPEHRAFAEWVGTWTGPTRTWFGPDVAPEEHTSRATVDALYDGRWVRIDYHGVVMKTPHAGQMIVGYHKDAREHEIAWIDSFHTGTAMMMSVGAPPELGTVRVLGSYAAGHERWGWRTAISLRDDELIIEMWNITPAGEEHRAVETRLRRT